MLERVSTNLKREIRKTNLQRTQGCKSREIVQFVVLPMRSTISVVSLGVMNQVEKLASVCRGHILGMFVATNRVFAFASTFPSPFSITAFTLKATGRRVSKGLNLHKGLEAQHNLSGGCSPV